MAKVKIVETLKNGVSTFAYHGSLCFKSLHEACTDAWWSGHTIEGHALDIVGFKVIDDGKKE